MMKKTRMMVWAVLAMFAMVIHIYAAALTAARDTPARTGVDVSIGVASNTVIYAGSMVAINTSGYAVPASDTASYKVVGRAQATVDNSGTAGNGALSVSVRRGVFRWVNGDTFTIADVGNLAYVEDDQTVQKAASATHDVVAGIIIDVDSDGVWVDAYAIGGQGAAALTTLTTTGNGAIGGTLAVTGNTTLGGTAAVTGNTTVGGTLGVTGNTTVSNIAASGTLAVTGVATFTAAPKLTATTTAGAETVTMTNAPAAGDPIWMDVTVGTNSYVIPLFPAE